MLSLFYGIIMLFDDRQNYQLLLANLANRIGERARARMVDDV